MKLEPEALIRRFARLEATRERWTALWQDCGDHLLSHRAGFVGEVTPGERRSTQLYDSTATQANELLAAGLHGMLTNPASRWFSLQLAGAPEGAEIAEARDWLAATEDGLVSALAESNMATQLHELYLGLGCFGTGCLYLEADAQGALRFSARDLAEIFIAEDAQGRIDTVFRRFHFTARQAAQAFGIEALPEKLRRAASDPQARDERHTFLHAVMPRADRDPGSARPEKLPYASAYIALEEKAVVSERGYHEFPYMVPRWSKAAGETYGRSPAMSVLADIRMLNEMCRTTIRAAQKAVDPPLLLPDEGFTGAVRMNPGGINFYRAGTREPIQAVPVSTNLGLGLEMEERRRAMIRQAFFLDQLQLQGGPQMTATEVLQRTEEKLRLMGPMLGRLQDELLGPLIRRAYGLLMRAGQLPPPPASLGGRIEIAYVSPIDRERRAEEAQAARRAVELLGPFVQSDPGLLELVDGERLFRHVAGLLGVPSGVLRDEREMAKRRREVQASQQGEQALQELGMGAEALAKGAPALAALQQADVAAAPPAELASLIGGAHG